MLEALLDALLDTGKLLPILFLTYLFMEYLEHHAGGRIARPAAVQGSGTCPGRGSGLNSPVRLFRCGFQSVCGGSHYNGHASGGVSFYF